MDSTLMFPVSGTALGNGPQAAEVAMRLRTFEGQGVRVAIDRLLNVTIEWSLCEGSGVLQYLAQKILGDRLFAIFEDFSREEMAA